MRGDEYDRHVLIYERYGAVFHLGGRIALGVDVRDLLEFQCPPRELRDSSILDPDRDSYGHR